MIYTHIYRPKQIVPPATLIKLNERIAAGTVYGEIKQPDICLDSASMERYATISVEMSALQLIEVDMVDQTLRVLYRKCGPLARYAPGSALVMRAYVANNEVVNIITFDYATP